jgi:hypothetical protein
MEWLDDDMMVMWKSVESGTACRNWVVSYLVMIGR